MTMKKCTRCHRLLPETEFNKCKGKKDGLRSRCKDCLKELRKIYYKEHLQETKEHNRVWRQEHKQELRDYNVKRYYENKEKELARNKKYYQHSKEKVNERKRKKHRKNPWKRNKQSRDRYLKKKQLFEDFTDKEWQEKVERTNGICPICNRPYCERYGLTLDHNPPVSLAEPGFHYTIANVQPMCGSCNSSKGNSV